MSTRARASGLGFIALLSLTGAAAHAADCGAREDAEKASHRALVLADFAGERPREKGRARSGGATTIQITTAMAVDELAVAVEPASGGRWRARFSELCVRAYLMKQLSGRRSETKAPWDLRHEQGHFDLTLAHTRALEEALRALTFAASDAALAASGLRELAGATYRARVAGLQREQDLYDRETRHGHARAAQGRWLGEIAARIAATTDVALEVAEP